MDFWIVFFRKTIVFLVQVRIELIQEFAGQDLSFLVGLVNRMFKLSKLGLTEDRTTETIQEVVENSKTGFIIFYFCQQLLSQDIFIGCGSNLSKEDRIIPIDIRLSLTSIARVHTVACLMHQGEEIVQCILPVQQHKGIGIV